MTEDFLDRFGGIARLYGLRALEQLAASHVCVVGVGGVGSWIVESLARSGIGALTLIDGDDVCITNTNRQLPALTASLGQPKVETLAARVSQIHPGCRVDARRDFLTPKNAELLLTGPFDYVVDAVDRMSIKAIIIATAKHNGFPVLTIGGAGGRRDPLQVRINDLNRSEGDALLRTVRKKLKRSHGFTRFEKKKFHVPAIFSTEPQIFPWADGSCQKAAEPGSNLKLDCSSGFGTASFVTGTFAFAATSEIIRHLTANPAA